MRKTIFIKFYFVYISYVMNNHILIKIILELKPTLEQPTTLMTPPAKRPRMYDESSYMPKILNNQTNYVSLKESHKEIASLLESPSPLLFLQNHHQQKPSNQQQQQQQHTMIQQQQKQSNCNLLGISTVSSQLQNSTDTIVSNSCNNLILTNSSNATKNSMADVSLMAAKSFDATSIIMDQIRQQLSQIPNQNNFNSSTTAAAVLKNYCSSTEGCQSNNINIDNFSDEPLNLCIREQY